MSEDINGVRRKLLLKEIGEIEKTLESQPRECLLQTHEKIKQILLLTNEEYFQKKALEKSYLIKKLGIDTISQKEKMDFFEDIYERYDACITKIDKPDQKIFDAVKEFVDLEMTFMKDTGACYGFSCIAKIAKKNPELLGQAVQFYKKHNNDFCLLKVAEKNPEFKKDIVDFLRDNINYDGENWRQLLSLANIANDEQITSKVISTIQSSEIVRKDFEVAAHLASFTNDEKDLKNAVYLLINYKVSGPMEDRPVGEYRSIAESQIENLDNPKVKQTLLQYTYRKADDEFFGQYKDGSEYTNFHAIIIYGVRSGADIISNVLDSLKRETDYLPSARKNKGYMYSSLDLQSETFFEALDYIVQKEPSRAKEAFEMGKDYNRALGLDEKFTCADSKSYYYHALGTFAKADESLKPEIISIIKENMAQDQKENPDGYDFKAGKKVLQELTMPQMNRGNGRVD